MKRENKIKSTINDLVIKVYLPFLAERNSLNRWIDEELKKSSKVANTTKKYKTFLGFANFYL